MNLKEMPTGGPRAMLNDAQYAAWSKANDETFDRLPFEVRMAIRETGVHVDCMKVEKALAMDVPVLTVCQFIEQYVQYQRAAELFPSHFKGGRA